MYSEQDIKKNWAQLKAQILKKWNKLNMTDVDYTEGNSIKLKKLVQNKYGLNERFDIEFERICRSTIPTRQHQQHTETKIGEPFKSSNMTNGWKKEKDMTTNSQSEQSKESVAGFNPGTDSTFGYEGLDTNTEQSDVQTGGQVNTKDFMHSTDPIISDRSYSEAPDEFSPNQDPGLKSMDIPLGGSDSSAFHSSAQNAAFNSFEDHSRSTKKL